MEVHEIARGEHLAFWTALDLEPLAARVAELLALPPFALASNGENEWGDAIAGDGVGYNLALPLEDGLLQEWDESVPEDCNAALMIQIARVHPRRDDVAWLLGVRVPEIARRLADGLGCVVYHHRSWLGPGRNERRSGRFVPAAP